MSFNFWTGRCSTHIFKWYGYKLRKAKIVLKLVYFELNKING